MSSSASINQNAPKKPLITRFLDGVEYLGNLLPHPIPSHYLPFSVLYYWLLRVSLGTSSCQLWTLVLKARKVVLQMA
ncbi:hypothetical protein VCSRO83_0061 [Vibrio cholerae]|nr:hypothetical protein VCSRO83_0061 [Vibrio cholerae]